VDNWLTQLYLENGLFVAVKQYVCLFESGSNFTTCQSMAWAL